MKIGYPRSLLYYKYFPFWDTFLKHLGAEVVLSAPTSKALLTQGTIFADNELCLPVKVFYGHLLDLKEKVDAIFVPRTVSVEKKTYTCPKFLGLPDMARAVDVELPPVLDPLVDVRNGLRRYWADVFEFGHKFTDSRTKILAAYRRGYRALRDYHHRLLAGETPLEILENGKRTPVAGSLTIGVAGHPYNIYDKYISMNLIKRLGDMGVAVRTPEMVPHKVADREAARLPKKLFWSYENEIVGTVFHWARSRSVDGIIYVLAFPCGPDSLIQVLLEHELRHRNLPVPLTSLVIDEHSAEAGLITRVEAFVDMLGRKKERRAC